MKKQTAHLLYDDKPSAKYHDGIIVKNEGNDEHILVNNKGAFEIVNSYGPSKRKRHMAVRYHDIQHQINKKVVITTWSCDS